VAEPGKPKRSYNSQRRRAQAAATKQVILAAAQRLFERDGYAATTVDAIAAEAGVALKTVYSGFGTKSGLLRALWDFLLKGDLEVSPVAERPMYLDMLDEPDPERQLRLNASNARMVKTRIGGLLRVIRSAASVDADSAALWNLIQSDFYENQRVLVASIAAHGGLPAGMTEREATDILWTLNHPDVWLLLVGERGWTPEAWETWFADTVCGVLIDRTGR
jgi:AcrR family transcriptional regulator